MPAYHKGIEKSSPVFTFSIFATINGFAPGTAPDAYEQGVLLASLSKMSLCNYLLYFRMKGSSSLSRISAYKTVIQQSTFVLKNWGNSIVCASDLFCRS